MNIKINNMKKLIFILYLVALLKLDVVQAQENDLINLDDLPPVEKFLRLVWETDIKNWNGAPLILEDNIISSFGIDSAISFDSGKKNSFPLKLEKKIDILFESDSKAIIKNLNSDKALFELDRKSGIFIRKQAKVVNSSIVIIQKEKKKIAAYDLTTKKQIWEYNSEKNIRNNFIVLKEKVCVFDEKGLNLLDINDGRTLWTKDIGNVYATPYFDANKLFALTNKNGLFCIDLDKRKINWTFKDHNSSIAQEHDMIVENNRIYFVSNWLYTLDFNGNEIWISKNDFHKEFSIVKNSIIAYIVDNDPIVIVLNKVTGKPRFFSSFGDNDYLLNSPMRFSYTKGSKVFSESAYINKVFCFEILE
jgi:hypothetical protein